MKEEAGVKILMRGSSHRRTMCAINGDGNNENVFHIKINHKFQRQRIKYKVDQWIKVQKLFST